MKDAYGDESPMNTFGTRLLVLDTESTGIDPEKDRIVELAAVYFVERAYASHRQMLIDPGIPIPKEASAIHHIGNEQVKGKPRFADVAENFLRHVDGVAESGDPPILVGYNAVSYDIPLLNAELARAGIDRRIPSDRVVDPVIFVRYRLRHMRGRKLTDLCQHYDIRLESAHRAAADARATGELLLRLVAEGIIPDDIDLTLRLQREHTELLEAEWNEFGYWLYRDRTDGQLRLGAGKHCGERLSDIDPGYLRYLLKTISDMNEAAREVFQSFA